MRNKKLIIYTLSFGIILSSSSVLADDCSDGLIWNENINQCLNATDNTRVDEKQRMCDSKADGEGKDACNEMVQSFSKDPKDYVSNSDVGISGKENSIKNLNTVKSVATGAVAAYKLYEAYDAAKGAKDLFSEMCISGMMSIATGVMSFMNDKTMDKQVKQTLKVSKSNLDALIAENESTKGTSYEMQIKLMQAYKQILEAGAQAAQIRENGYKQEVTMYSLALGIAAIEAVVYSLPPTPQMDKVKCAGWVAGSATVSVLLGSKMKSSASDAKDKYTEEANKLGKILDKYMDFFDKKHIDSTSLATTFAVGSSSSAPINAKSGSEANEFSNSKLTDAEVEMCSNVPTTECCNDSGKSCPTFNVSIGNPTISSAIGKSGLSGALERADARLNGSLNLGDSDVSLALDKDLKRAGAFKQRVLEQLKDKGKLSTAQAEMFDTDKQVKAFLKKQYGNENTTLGSSFGDSMALPDVDRISKIIDKGEVPKELKNDKKNLSSSLSSYSNLSKLQNSLSSLSFDDEEDFSASDNLNETGLKADEEYVYDKDQIVDKPEVSIFKVISNRYNVLRINKRFGQRASK